MFIQNMIHNGIGIHMLNIESVYNIVFSIGNREPHIVVLYVMGLVFGFFN